MASAYDYSTTANSNTSVGGVSIAEGMNPSAVNNAIRAALADNAKLRKDMGGANVSSGNDTITLTSSSTISAYADGQPFLFIAGGTNTGAATLNIDSVGAKAVRKGADVALAAGDITAGMPCHVVYDASANSAAGAWLLLNPYTGQQSFQPLDSDLTAIAALTTASYGRALLELTDAAALTALSDAVVGDSGSGGTKGLVPAPGSGDAAAGKFLKADGTWTAPSPVAVLPVGTVVPYSGLTEPSGWLFCYGQAISRSTYSALYAIVGDTYGAGDASTTFNLPDLRGRVVAGQDDMGGSSANRLTAQTGGLNGDTLGATGGAETHELTAAQIPANNDPGDNAQASSSGGSVDVAAKSHTGTGSAHNNVQPTIILNYVIYTAV